LSAARRKLIQGIGVDSNGDGPVTVSDAGLRKIKAAHKIMFGKDLADDQAKAIILNAYQAGKTADSL